MNRVATCSRCSQRTPKCCLCTLRWFAFCVRGSFFCCAECDRLLARRYRVDGEQLLGDDDHDTDASVTPPSIAVSCMRMRLLHVESDMAAMDVSRGCVTGVWLSRIACFVSSHQRENSPPAPAVTQSKKNKQLSLRPTGTLCYAARQQSFSSSSHFRCAALFPRRCAYAVVCVFVVACGLSDITLAGL